MRVIHSISIGLVQGHSVIYLDQGHSTCSFLMKLVVMLSQTYDHHLRKFLE